jgi:hypothetical protein
MYPEDTEFPVYCRNCWYSDKWSALDYGRDYDFSKNFFIQFGELLKVVPRVALQMDNCVNCDYANQIANCKNCYLISSGSDNEDCMYDFRVLNSKKAIDCLVVLKCENCYEARDSRDSADLLFSSQCSDSFDLSFCNEVRASNHCFMSVNLRNASHVFRGRKLSKEEYQRAIAEIDTGSYANVKKYEAEFDLMISGNLRRFAANKNVVNCSGNVLSNSKGSWYCFNGAYLENCRYSLFINNSRDSSDVNNGCCQMELVYETCTAGVNASNIRFCVDAWPEARSVEYSDCCRDGASDLFGCISMRDKSHCVLNKQYAPQEYRELVAKIRKQMEENAYTDKEERTYKYGEFFPPEFSPFPYEESSAQVLNPIFRNKEKLSGTRPFPGHERNYTITLKPEELPDHIKDVADTIIQETIGCLHGGTCADQCVTAFKITKDELEFYRKKNVPLPRLCPNCRHSERLRRSDPIGLWNRQCMCEKTGHDHPARCPNKFLTVYSPNRKEIVYCESCYNSEVV